MLCNKPDASSTGFTLSKEKGSDTYPHLLLTLAVILKQKKVSFWNLYLRHVACISHHNSKTCRVSLCFKISNRFFKSLKICYAMENQISRKTTENAITGPGVIRVVRCLSVHILIGSEEFIYSTDSICMKSSHIRRLVQFYKVNVKIGALFHLIFNCSVRLSDLNALSTGDNKIMAPRRPHKVSQRTIVLREKLESKKSIKTIYFQLLLSR